MAGQLLEIDVLLRRIASLEAQVASLQAEVARLGAENACLQNKNARPQAENVGLWRRLGLNSQNSHKPPSSDGYRKKQAQPALLPFGGQPGHKGKTLRPAEKPDRVEVHLPERCAVCGRPISPDEPYEVVGRRQVFDLPEPRLELTEHRLGQILLRAASMRGVSPYVTAGVQYGPGVRVWVAKLSVDHKMPLEQIGLLFQDLFG